MAEVEVLPYARLRFNIDVPFLEETWLDGYESASADRDEDSNPYQPGSQEHFQWSEGWWAGFYGEEPLFDFAGNVNDAALSKADNTVVAQASKTVNSFIHMTKERLDRMVSYMGQLLGGALAWFAMYQLFELLLADALI